VRLPARRLAGQCHCHHPLHRVRRQPGLTAPTLRDRADLVDALFGETVPPSTHRVRVHPAPPGALLVGNSIGRPQQCLSLHYLTMRQRRRGRDPSQFLTLIICYGQRRSHLQNSAGHQTNFPTDHSDEMGGGTSPSPITDRSGSMSSPRLSTRRGPPSLELAGSTTGPAPCR
jgi:hypothetical protein